MKLFIVVIAIVLGINIAWYVVSDSWLRHDLAKYPLAKKYTRIALTAWMTIIFLPVIGAGLGLGNPLESAPWIWIASLYLWIGAIFFWMFGMTVLGIPIWSYLRYKKYKESKKNRFYSSEKNTTSEVVIEVASEVASESASDAIEESIAEAQKTQLSRRQLIKLGLVATPPLLVSGASVASVLGKRNLNVRIIELPVRNLPLDLEGYTITQLSDTHIGMLTGRERVENIVKTANQLNSNITVVTGDILDNNVDYMPDLIDTMSQLRADQGVYMCIGNHDKMYDADNWIDTVRRAGLNLLLDESAIIDTGSTPIKLLGIDYASNEKQDIKNIRRADEDIRTPDNSLKLLLAHHPHAFDAASQANIPITLAGHTHGGQLAIWIGEDYELFNAGNYLFRYVDGIYRKDDGSSLFVHRGSGDWFPLRTGVPAEVVQLRLVKALDEG